MEWGKVKDLPAGGAVVELGSGLRQRPMKIPRGLVLSVGDKVLVEQVAGAYTVIGAYGGDSDS